MKRIEQTLSGLEEQYRRNFRIRPTPTDVRFVVVPYWIDGAIKRNNLNHMDLLDYTKARTIMSRQDVQDFLVAQNISMLGKANPFYHVDEYGKILDYWYESITDAEKQELKLLVEEVSLQLEDSSSSEQLLKKFSDRFSEKEAESFYDYGLNGDGDKDKPAYEIVRTKDKVCFILLNKGSSHSFQDTALIKQFLSDLLKSMYTFASIQQVGYDYKGQEIFRKYLDALR